MPDTEVYEDVQCGRCGSSMGWEDCDGCDGGFYESEDPDGMYEPELRTCPACDGRGGWWQCLSDYTTDVDGRTWCERNPRTGRSQVPCSAVEEFAVGPDGTVTYQRGRWAELIDGRPPLPPQRRSGLYGVRREPGATGRGGPSATPDTAGHMTGVIHN